MLFSLFGKEKGDMDPTTTEILFQVIKRIPNVENERRECQQTLDAFLDHMTARTTYSISL